MNFISAENISKSFGEKWLFKNISIGISQGEKVALVGANGSGKTTLMNILAGVIPSDGGSVSVRRGVSVGYLDQNPSFDLTMSVIDTTFSGNNPMVAAIKKYEKSLISENGDELSEAIELMESLKAWDYEVKIKQILGRLGIEDFEKKISQLSGGQKKRVALARILIEEPDLIIMDEPTNHLDLEMIEWLESFLATENRTLLLVTHDRYFLDKVCNRIVALENGKVARYEGDYAYYLEKKAEKEAIEAAELSKNKNTFRKELEWMRRQPKARGTKAQYRVDAFEELKEKVIQKKPDSGLELNVKMTRVGSKILEINHLHKSFGGQEIVKDFNYVFKKGDRIGIVGKNGVGKSTFLNMLTGNIQPDSGLVDKGDTTTFGYYTQSELIYTPGQKVLDVVKDIAEVITLGTGETISASAFLTHFQFQPAVQYTPVEKLSGGEKRRLQLLKVLIKNPNFLILDEPTNDLDITTLNILEDFLLNFGGCLLLVSHDRYFMDKLVEHLFVFQGEGKIKDFNGNYTDYREWLDEEEINQKKSSQKNPKPVIEKPIVTSSNTLKKKLTFNEQREYEELESQIEELEKTKNLILEKLNSENVSHGEISSLVKEIEAIDLKISEKTDRWVELSELV